MAVSGPIPEGGVGQADGGAGPDIAFDAFARGQRRALVAFAWTLTGDVGAAEDVAQDALHATWLAWDRGGGIRHPEGPDRSSPTVPSTGCGVWGAIGSTASTAGDRAGPPLDLQADFADGTVVVWGVMWVDAASATVEAPGVEPVTLATYEVEGWSHPVVADAFPDDHFPPAGDVVVVARDADGREVARNAAVLGDGD